MNLALVTNLIDINHHICKATDFTLQQGPGDKDKVGLLHHRIPASIRLENLNLN